MVKGTFNNKLGNIEVKPDVIAYYAGSQAVQCSGVVGMAAMSMKDGLFRLLKVESLSKGVQVYIDDDNKLYVDFHIIVAYGVNICSVADNIIENVKYKLEEFTGFEVSKINIYVEGVRVID